MSRAGTVLERLQRHWLAVVLFVVLPVMHTWPLATNPAVLSLNDNGDTQLNEWILAWVAHQLPRNPAKLFDGNIFYPAKDALAFSEPLIVPAVAGAPILWLGGSPVLTYNLLLLLGFTVTGLATYALVFSWTGDRSAGMVAGSLFAFNTHTLTRLAHLQAIHAYGLPLALLAVDRLIRQPSARAALSLALAMALMAYTSGYLFVFACLVVGIAVVARVLEWRHHPRDMLTALALAALTTAAVVLPIAVVYRRVAVEQGMVRSIESVRDFSATLTGYLAGAGRVHYSTWSSRFFVNPVDAFFPGVAAILLSAVAIVAAIRWSPSLRSRMPAKAAPRSLGEIGPARRSLGEGGRVAMMCCIGAAGFVLSLGLQTPVYGWLHAVFPPMHGLRAAARFGNLFLLAVAILAGLGLAQVRQRLSRRQWAAAVPIAALVLVNVEALSAPFVYRPFNGIPRVYDLLAREPGRVVLVETPFYPAHAVFENAEYVLNSTAHWRPLMNGYSGYTPESYRRIAWTFWYFPRDYAIQAMRDAGVTHFTVHPRRFGNEAAETLAILARRQDIELVAIGARDGIRLYRFVDGR